MVVPHLHSSNHRTANCPFKGCCASCGKKGDSYVSCPSSAPAPVGHPDVPVSQDPFSCPAPPPVFAPPDPVPSESCAKSEPPSISPPPPLALWAPAPPKEASHLCPARVDSSLSFSLARSATAPPPSTCPKEFCFCAL